MSIEVACQCGKTFKTKDEHAGLRAKCPSCGAPIDIPAASPGVPVIPSGFRIADLQKALEEHDLASNGKTTLADLLDVLKTIATSIRPSSQTEYFREQSTT